MSPTLYDIDGAHDEDRHVGLLQHSLNDIRREGITQTAPLRAGHHD
jgi:hypothetical protein